MSAIDPKSDFGGKSGSGLLVFAVIVVGGVLRIVLPAGTASTLQNKTTTTSVTAAAQSAATASDYADLLKQKIKDSFGCGEESETQKLDDNNHWNVPASSRNATRFLVAFVPDPVHTHLSLLFDRDVEAIQLGAQQRGAYAYDQSILPWHPASQKNSDGAKSESSKERAEGEAFPGLLIFRRSISATPKKSNSDSGCPAKKALLVFLVGETPTGGIRAAQFQNALKIMREIRDDPVGASASANEQLLLLGPNFSGSLDSLSRQIQQIPVTQHISSIFSYSGTVTGANSSNAFRDQVAANSKVPMQFVSFQENDDYALQMFARFASCQGYGPEEIAVLSEDDTVYGNQGAAHTTAESLTTTPDDKATRATPICQDPVGDLNFKKSVDDMLYLHFPREISHFREAYQKELAAQQPSARIPGKTSLPTVTNEESAAEDDVKPFADGQTSLSQEAVMVGVVSELEKHHIKFTILLATNPVDQVFLARYLRTNYPQGRVVVTTPDLLLASQTDSLLSGVLGLNNYPLVPGLSDSLCRFPGNSTAHVDRLFDSSLSVGIFNAMQGLLSLLDSPQDASELSTANAVPTAPYAEFASPMLSTDSHFHCSAKPMLWVTILGSDGFWPLAALTNVNDKSLNNEIPVVPTSEVWGRRSSLPHGPWPLDLPEDNPLNTRTAWNITYCICLTVLVIHMFFSLTGSFLANSESRAQFARSRDWHGTFVIAMGAFWLSAAFVLVMCTRNLLIVWHGFPGSTALLWSPFPVFVAATIYDLGKLRERPMIALYFAIATYTMTVFQIWLAAGWISPIPYLWSNRLTHFGSGVTPILPFLLLFAAGYWWCWIALRSISIVDLRRPRLPSSRELSVTSIRISDAEGEVVRDTAHPLKLARRILAVLGGMFVFALTSLDWKHPLQSLEGTAYDWGYSLAFGSAIAVFLGCLMRLVFTWFGYKQVLAGLDRSPLRDAFSRMKRLSWSSMWNPGGSTLRETYRIMSRTLENMDRLKHMLEDPVHKGPAEVHDKIVDTREKLDDVRNEFHALFPQADQAESADQILEQIKSTHRSLESSVERYEPLFSSVNQEVLAHASAAQVFYLVKNTNSKFDLERYAKLFSPVNGSEPKNSATPKWKAFLRKTFDAVLNPGNVFSRSQRFETDPRRLSEIVGQIRSAHDKLVQAIKDFDDHFGKVKTSQSTLPDGAHSRLKKIQHAQAKLTAALDRYASLFPDAGCSNARTTILANLTSALEELQKNLANTAGAVLTKILEPHWKIEELIVVSVDKRLKMPELKMCRAIEEEFVALVYVNFLQSVLLQMRTLVICAGGMYVFLLCSVSAYPFEPHLALQILAIALLVFMATAVGFVYKEMHRDAILSRLTSSKAGQLGWDFWIKFISAGAIPVFSLLAVQFPEIGRFLFSWLEPALQAVK